jgi:hypothetical protein
MKPLNKISLLLCLFLLTSCYESLDFKQLDNVILKPIFTSALIYFNAVPFQFFDSAGVQQNSISDITNIDGLQNELTEEYLVKLDFNAEIKNELDRGVTFTVAFLNSNSKVVHTLTPIVVSADVLDYTYLEEVEIVFNSGILDSNKVRITAELENTGTPLDMNDTKEFVFKSSVTLYIESSF